jgi:hypothetical protein
MLLFFSSYYTWHEQVQKLPIAANRFVVPTPDTIDSTPLHPQEAQNNRPANTGKLHEFHDPRPPDRDSYEGYPLL